MRRDPEWESREVVRTDRKCQGRGRGTETEEVREGERERERIGRNRKWIDEKPNSPLFLSLSLSLVNARSGDDRSHQTLESPD